MSTVVRHLILKDLLLMRWWMVGTIAGGLIAAWLMTLSAQPISAGGVLMICTLIILNIFVVMAGVVTERKEHVALFLFTFPVSRRQYVAAKVAANAIAFGLPWLVLSLAVVAAIRLSAMPDGYLPLWTALLGFVFFYYCVLLGVGLNTEANGWHATTITIGNIATNFFIMLLFGVPSVQRFGSGPIAVWAPDILWITVSEMVLGVVVLAVAAVVRARRADFI
jgi:ABC-type transport system involved in multi-copper enzyme maturation permease subunit